MKKVHLNIIHSCDLELDIVASASIYVPKETVYFIPDKTSPFNFIAGYADIERQKKEAIDRYDNVLKGLNYWKNKATENNK